MDVFSRQELKEILDNETHPCVSMYMPTLTGGQQSQQNPIRFRNLLKQSQARLVDVGLRTPEARELLAPARRLQNDSLFWNHQSKGFALFISPGLFRFYRLPLTFVEEVVVSDIFHIKPLIPLLTTDGRFYLLALSQKSVRFFQCSHLDINEVDLRGVPRTIADTLKHDVFEKEIQFHTGTADAGGRRPAIFHGSGDASEDTKDEIFEYFRQVDRGLHTVLREKKEPLMLACVDYLLSIYREANTYPHLLDENVTGNPDALSPEDLHGQAWKIVKPYFEEREKKALARYGELAATPRTSLNIRKIVPAAHQGRIDVLLVAHRKRIPGTFDPSREKVSLHRKEKPGDEDLLDRAAIETIMNGGTVYVMEPEKMPEGSAVAALFRY
jgi:hypothetical protein